MRSDRKGPPSSGTKKLCARRRHHRHGRPGGHLENGLGQSGTGQKYAIMARKHIAALREKEPGVKIKIRWCPSHQGIKGNVAADGRAKRARCPRITLRTRVAKSGKEVPPEIPGQCQAWDFEEVSGGQEKLDKTKNRKYRPCEKREPDPAAAHANKRLASHLNQLKTGHCLTGQHLARTTRRSDANCYGASIRFRLASICSRTARNGKANKSPSGQPSWKRLESSLAQPGAGTAELFADERCSQAILDFLATTDVGSHRWQKVQEQRPARPWSGTVGNARNGSQL